jgi:cholesterol transport system auxiliary component
MWGLHSRYRHATCVAALKLCLAGGVALGLGGCAALGLGGESAPPAFDLTAPQSFGKSFHGSRGQLVVADPSALAVLDSDRVVVRAASGEIATLPGAQWRDRLPKLLQARIIETFENANRLRGVGRPTDKLATDYQLLIDIRAFEISILNEPTAQVELTVKIVNERAGRIVAANVFRAQVPAAKAEGPEATVALDEAFGRAAVDIVRWAARYI